MIICSYAQYRSRLIAILASLITTDKLLLVMIEHHLMSDTASVHHFKKQLIFMTQNEKEKEKEK